MVSKMSDKLQFVVTWERKPMPSLGDKLKFVGYRTKYGRKEFSRKPEALLVTARREGFRRQERPHERSKSRRADCRSRQPAPGSERRRARSCAAHRPARPLCSN